MKKHDQHLEHDHIQHLAMDTNVPPQDGPRDPTLANEDAARKGHEEQTGLQDDAINRVMHHPLMQDTRILITPSINQFCKAVRRIVLLRQMGVYFSGTSGVGKSKAVDAAIAYLSKTIPRLPVIHHNTHNKQMPSIRAFFKHFLDTVGHPDKQGETYDLRARAVNRIVDEARQSGYNLIVMIIDEAQAMGIDDFNFLKDISNDLAKVDVQLLTILMSQEPDFKGVVNLLRDKQRLDLISRFAIKNIPFLPYSTFEEVESILAGIDAEIYPADKGTTWTEFFFPQAYANGFRMKDEAKRLVAGLKAASPVKKGKGYVFPARQLFAAIRVFLLDNAGYDSSKMVIPASAWQEAISCAEINQAMALTNLSDRSSNEIRVKKK